jgi:hypothetical protein
MIPTASNLEPTLVDPPFIGSLFLSTQFLATILNYTRLQLLAMMGFYPASRASWPYLWERDVGTAEKASPESGLGLQSLGSAPGGLDSSGPNTQGRGTAACMVTLVRLRCRS